MAKVIEERFTNWQGQDFDEDTLEPSELTEALMEYLVLGRVSGEGGREKGEG